MVNQPAAMTPRQIAAALDATTAILQAQWTSLPEPLLRWRPEPDEWCVLDTVGHVIEAQDRGFDGRVRQMLAEDDPVFATWDPPAVARARRDHERDPAALLAEFVDRRAASVALVAALSPEELSRGGRHPEVGRLTIDDLLHEWIHHDQEHLHQILALIQRFVWPHMGNAQRFSRP